MKAAVLYKPKSKFVVEDVDVDEPKKGEVLVRMVAGGVCHSDLHVVKGDLDAPFPIILGHEGAGIVETVGEGVTDFAKGDHVVPIWRASCGQCEWCSGGRPALCDAAMEARNAGCLPAGGSRFHKGSTEIRHWLCVSTFASLSVMSEVSLVKIRKDIDLDKAALVGCGVVTGVGAVTNTARVREGSSVAVIGTGGVGLNVIQGAAMVGAEKIIAVDVFDSKLELAREMGATETVNAKETDPVRRVRELTGGEGVDYSFEVIGVSETADQAVKMLRKRGVAVLVGLGSRKAAVTAKMLPMVMRETTVTGCMYGSARPRQEIPKLIDLYLTGELKLDPLLTRSYPLEEINEAFDALERGENARSVVTYS